MRVDRPTRACSRVPVSTGVGDALARGAFAFTVIAAVTGVASCSGCGDVPRDAFDGEAGDAEAGGPEPIPPAEGGAPLSSCEQARVAGGPVGCEYLVFPVPDGSTSNEGCTAVFLSNPTQRPAQIDIQRDGTVLEVGQAARLVSMTLSSDPGYVPLAGATLPPGASAVVALVQGELAQFPVTQEFGHCPIPALVDESHRGAHDVSDVLAFRIHSSEPVFATYFHPYAYGWTWFAPLASNALRSSGSWDAHNIDVGVFKPGRPLVQHRRNGDAIYDDMAAFLAVGAVRDARVSISGESAFVDVPAGHVVRLKRDDLRIGAAVTSDVPVAVFVGSKVSFLPYDTGGANPLLDQVPPQRAWSSEYAAVRYPNRYEDATDVAIYRIIAEKDGTTLSYEPSRPEGAPDRLDAGQLGVFLARETFVVRSQDDGHHFHATVAMTGYEQVQPEQEAARGIAGRGGPELVSLVPRSEFANRFAFMTDHTYPDVHLVLVRAKENGVFHDVNLACAGVVTGWKPLGKGDSYETATVTLSKGKFEPVVYPGGTCHNGPHTMQSDGPFTGYVWGWAHDGAIDLEPHRDGGGVSFGFALYGITSAALGTGR